MPRFYVTHDGPLDVAPLTRGGTYRVWDELQLEPIREVHWYESRICRRNRVNRFGNVPKAPTEIEWLTDNGSGYIADKTRSFASDIGLKPLTTPVCSPQSNGMAESFVKTMKRDYVAFMPKPDAATAVRNLAVAFEHYNEKHPHSALKYRSPREFRRRTDSSTLV